MGDREFYTAAGTGLDRQGMLKSAPARRSDSGVPSPPGEAMSRMSRATLVQPKPLLALAALAGLLAGSPGTAAAARSGAQGKSRDDRDDRGHHAHDSRRAVGERGVLRRSRRHRPRRRQDRQRRRRRRGAADGGELRLRRGRARDLHPTAGLPDPDRHRPRELVDRRGGMGALAPGAAGDPGARDHPRRRRAHARPLHDLREQRRPRCPRHVRGRPGAARPAPRHPARRGGRAAGDGARHGALLRRRRGAAPQPRSRHAGAPRAGDPRGPYRDAAALGGPRAAGGLPARGGDGRPPPVDVRGPRPRGGGRSRAGAAVGRAPRGLHRLLHRQVVGRPGAPLLGDRRPLDPRRRRRPLPERGHGGEPGGLAARDDQPAARADERRGALHRHGARRGGPDPAPAGRDAEAPLRRLQGQGGAADRAAARRRHPRLCGPAQRRRGRPGRRGVAPRLRPVQPRHRGGARLRRRSGSIPPTPTRGPASCRSPTRGGWRWSPARRRRAWCARPSRPPPRTGRSRPATSTSPISARRGSSRPASTRARSSTTCAPSTRSRTGRRCARRSRITPPRPTWRRISSRSTTPRRPTCRRRCSCGWR